MKKLLLMLSIFTIQMSFASYYVTERVNCDNELYTCIAKCKKGDRKCKYACDQNNDKCIMKAESSDFNK